jgi:hypothetical protein
MTGPVAPRWRRFESQGLRSPFFFAFLAALLMIHPIFSLHLFFLFYPFLRSILHLSYFYSLPYPSFPVDRLPLSGRALSTSSLLRWVCATLQLGRGRASHAAGAAKVNPRHVLALQVLKDQPAAAMQERGLPRHTDRIHIGTPRMHPAPASAVFSCPFSSCLFYPIP